MKKLILLVLSLSISSICWAQTDENDSIPNSDAVVESIATFAPKQSFYLKNGKTKLVHNFRLGFLLGKDNVMSPSFSGTSEDFTEDITKETEQGTTYGLSLAYRLSFFPGKMEKNQTFQVNPLGFGYSFGIDVTGDFQKNYDFSCDVLATAGFELGGSRVGFGIDALIGTGNLIGFIVQEHATDPKLCGSFKMSTMSFKYGAQIWLKVPSVFGKFLGPQAVGSGNDLRLFVRYLANTIPETGVVDDFTTFSMFSTESLQVGISFTF